MIEKMPFQLGIDERPAVSQGNEPQDWRAGLPELSNDVVTLREIRVSDAHALFAMLSTEAVGRFMSAPPPSVDAFIRFIEWTLSERAVGRYLCFAVVPAGYDVPVGILQMRQVQPTFAIAEWGAAIGAAFWGTGVLVVGAVRLTQAVRSNIPANAAPSRDIHNLLRISPGSPWCLAPWRHRRSWRGAGPIPTP